ncbi:hypothetical protein Hdeb2414_s0009g00322201 [Helianthus debilis subsp. tardiflorus]
MKSITLRHHSTDHSTTGETKRLATSVMQSITTLLILCARRAVIASRKLKNNSCDSPVIQRPKKLIANISNKAITKRHRKQRIGRDDNCGGFEHDGLWQREILMGDKDGKRTDEFPMRYPRASPVPGYLQGRT